MKYENILFQLEDGVATLTFNRPKALNALNSGLFDEVSDVLSGLIDDASARVLVLTGAGEKAFVAGADIAELAGKNVFQAKLFSEKGRRVMDNLQTLPIPVIAAVNGFALGGGCEMALACDFIYASEKAYFGVPEVNLALIPGFGGTQRLSRRVGIGRAKEMIFTGERISAAEAERIGIVNRVFPAAALMEEVMKTAKAIAAKGKIVLRAAKEVVNTGVETDLATGCDLETGVFSSLFASQDAAEGMRAFLEKRKPEFKGSFNG
jgi:enoyl-CoA hydratase